jgi:hypothetical protein
MFNFLRFVFSGIPSTKAYEAKLQDRENKYTIYLETFESDALRRYTELKEYLSNPAHLKVGSDQPRKERQLKEENQSKRHALSQKERRLRKEFQAKEDFQPKRENQLKKDLLLRKKSAQLEAKQKLVEGKRKLLEDKQKLSDNKRRLSIDEQQLPKKERRRLLKDGQQRFEAERRQLLKDGQQRVKDEHRRRQEELRLFNEETQRLKRQIEKERRRLKEEGKQLNKEFQTERRQLDEEFKRSNKQLKADLKQQKDELQQLKNEFKDLEHSKIIKDFFSFKKKYSKLLEEQERWVLKFYEDFSKPEIDPRWSNKQIVSEQLINGVAYSPIEDQHIFTPSNVQQVGGLLKIKTKQEKKEGLAWDKTYGLIPKTFSYTSGMLTSSHSFKQLYGKFEAKIHVKQTHGTYHAFWMGSDTKKPHLNVFKFEGNNLFISAYSNDVKIEKNLKYSLQNDFYIFTLMWTNHKLTWLINGKKVFETSNIINQPMYISFSSGVYDKKAESTTMYIDWVRCYRSNK